MTATRSNGHAPAHVAGEPLARLRAITGAIADEADRETGFPATGLDLLRAAGLLHAVLPEAHGGSDLGCDRQGAPVATVLRTLGGASISLARLVEGHLNALRLVVRYADPTRLHAAAAAARGGALFALWVTDGDRPLSVRDGLLEGGKAFCSGAGHATHALVTARSAAAPEAPPTMFLVEPRNRPPGTSRAMTGVRGAVTADMPLDGLRAGAAIGAPGDYLRRPEFPVGAWRGSAIACGALEALVAAAIAHLVARDRHRDPHQAARIGRLLIARDTAIAWTDRAAVAADDPDPDQASATVGLARIAVETACLEAIELVQRGIGLAAFASGTSIERIMRDLATYLRQPAPDETLVEAALLFARNPG